MLNPLVWYIGAGTRMVWGWLTGIHCAMNGVARVRASTTPAAVLRMTFGRPVEPELQMPLSAGETISGSALSSSPGATAAMAGRFVLAEHQRRVDDVEQPLLLPVGQVPAHRDGYRADLPGGQGGHDQLHRVRDRQRHHRTLRCTDRRLQRPAPTGWPRGRGSAQVERVSAPSLATTTSAVPSGSSDARTVSCLP